VTAAPVSDEASPVAYAGFGRRCVAYVIDWALLGGAFELLRLMLIPVALRDDPEIFERYSDDLLLFSAAFGVVLWGYHAGFESSRLQATLGKAALGLRVTGLAGGRVSLSTATLRNWPDWIFAPVMMLGAVSSAETYAEVITGVEMLAAGIVVLSCLAAAFTERRQAAHDMMAGCLVVRKGAKFELQAPDAP
jgi:uncharacterized RDD family membrane protein YckC